MPFTSDLPVQNLNQTACLSCRSVKMKCRRAANSTLCERCLRKSLGCVFEKHRRGRKPGTRLSRSRTDTVVNSSSMVHSEEHVPAEADQPSSVGFAWGASPHSSRQSMSDSPLAAEGRGLHPSALLSRDAQTGKFSLQNVLSINSLLRSDSDERQAHGGNEMRAIEGSHRPDDPIVSGILSYPIALGLFDNFLRCMNPYISQFDPELHTLEYIQQKSSILLSAILSASSKAFHPPLHSRLRSHTETLLAQAFISGDKSVEVVQAILVMTYWKEPEETRTWLLIGYAIRMCLELGWHELVLQKSDEVDNETENAARERRNIERTWLVIFVYDRSLSSQLGKPAMIEQTDLIRNADNWHLERYSVPSGDLLLSSFVRLRILSSETLGLISPNQSVLQLRQSEMLLKVLNAEITRWEKSWIPLFESDSIGPCQRFLVKFYGLHVRLLLNSLPLQESLLCSREGEPSSKQVLLVCFTSAIGMLKQISEDFGPLKLLYFAQDSVHVMTAYAVIFLYKLLLSVPRSTREDLEAPTVLSTQEAAETFKDQCATQTTGCALQARFLQNVIEKYQHMKLQAKITAEIAPQLIPTDTEAHKVRTCDAIPANAVMGIEYENEIGNYGFADNDVWEFIFADAGFRINDGVFMPS